jgi:hypothetical protein
VTPRWKIRRGWLVSQSNPVWHVYEPGDNIPAVSFNLWENAVTYVGLVAAA